MVSGNETTTSFIIDTITTQISLTMTTITTAIMSSTSLTSIAPTVMSTTSTVMNTTTALSTGLVSTSTSDAFPSPTSEVTPDTTNPGGYIHIYYYHD